MTHMRHSTPDPFLVVDDDSLVLHIETICPSLPLEYICFELLWLNIRWHIDWRAELRFSARCTATHWSLFRQHGCRDPGHLAGLNHKPKTLRTQSGTKDT